MVQSEKKAPSSVSKYFRNVCTKLHDVTFIYYFFAFAAKIIVTLDCRVSVMLKLLVSIFTTC